MLNIHFLTQKKITAMVSLKHTHTQTKGEYFCCNSICNTEKVNVNPKILLYKCRHHKMSDMDI